MAGAIECYDKDCVHHECNDNHNPDTGPYCTLDDCENVTEVEWPEGFDYTK